MVNVEGVIWAVIRCVTESEEAKSSDGHVKIRHAGLVLPPLTPPTFKSFP